MAFMRPLSARDGLDVVLVTVTMAVLKGCTVLMQCLNECSQRTDSLTALRVLRVLMYAVALIILPVSRVAARALDRRQVRIDANDDAQP